MHSIFSLTCFSFRTKAVVFSLLWRVIPPPVCAFDPSLCSVLWHLPLLKHFSLVHFLTLSLYWPFSPNSFILGRTRFSLDCASLPAAPSSYHALGGRSVPDVFTAARAVRPFTISFPGSRHQWARIAWFIGLFLFLSTWPVSHLTLWPSRSS